MSYSCSRRSAVSQYPVTPLRTLLDKLFSGDSPYVGFPPEHTTTGVMTRIDLVYNVNISAFGNHVTFVIESGEVIDDLPN
ncbi:Sulfite exporter TauE/SafE family protein [Zea mays]|uniref:Sulfite exporter TauE/SafE family protein n=1 Tax=Zea mays TaxID=4577 RepID=A0A1D6N9P5_MAIZE|nr:Sulfite exporter TauE/SafE family protein [Zea mays]